MVKRKPQYVKIKEYIIQNIEDEKYNENEQIESEHALCELFGVTRMTVRQALTELQKTVLRRKKIVQVMLF